jgi:hypothetical protein
MQEIFYYFYFLCFVFVPDLYIFYNTVSIPAVNPAGPDLAERYLMLLGCTGEGDSNQGLEINNHRVRTQDWTSTVQRANC